MAIGRPKQSADDVVVDGSTRRLRAYESPKEKRTVNEDQSTVHRKLEQLAAEKRSLLSQLERNEEECRALFAEKHEIVGQEVAAWLARFAVARVMQDPTRSNEVSRMDTADSCAPNERRIWWDQGDYSFFLRVAWVFELSDEPRFYVELTVRDRWAPVSSFGKAVGDDLDSTIVKAFDSVAEKLFADHEQLKGLLESVREFQASVTKL